MALKRDKHGRIKRRLGDRFNGRKLRTLPPMMYAVPFIMKERCDAQNYFSSRVDMDVVEAFLRQCKSSENENLKGLGFTNVTTQKDQQGQLITGWMHVDGEIYSFIINGKISNFSDGAQYPYDTPIVITYYFMP